MPYRTELKRPDLKGNFPCTVCGKVFCHSSSLSRHRMQAHFKSYTCSQCNQEITSNETLRTHMYKYHQISRMFMCRCCNWAFPDKTSLHIHMQSMARTGRPGEVAVLARSSIEACSGDAFLHLAGDADGATHSQSSSPHDLNDAVDADSKPAVRHIQPKLLTGSAAQQLLNHPEFLGALSALLNSSANVSTSATIKRETVFPSPQTTNPNHVGSDDNNYDNYSELMKRLTTDEKPTKELLYMLGALSQQQTAVTVAPATVVATQPPTTTASQRAQQQQQHLLLGFLKNNPHLSTSLADNANGKNAILSALSRQSGQPTTTAVSSTGQPQHLPHTPSGGASAMMSDISRLLSISTGGAPAAKRLRVTTNTSVSPAASVLNTLKAFQRANQNQLKSEPSDDFGTGTAGGENGLNLSIATSLSGMQMAEQPLTAQVSAGGESSSVGALSSSASSSRAETPSAKLESLLDKMHAARTSSALETPGCVTPTDERRNKRKARAPRHVKLEASESDSHSSSNVMTEGQTHLPAAPTNGVALLENISRMVAGGVYTAASASEQPSPAVSDSQTSGSSTATAAATQLLELITGSGAQPTKTATAVVSTATPSPAKVCCVECQRSQTESEKLKLRLAELKSLLANKPDFSDSALKARLECVHEMATSAARVVEPQMEALLDCLRKIQALSKIQVDDSSPLEHPKPSSNEDDNDENNDELNIAGVDDENESHGGENENDIEMDDEVEEDDETIEIHCGPSPGESAAGAPTPSPRPDITSA